MVDLRHGDSMTAPSNANTSGLENAGHIVWWKAGGVSYYPEGEAFTVSKSCRVEPLVTAASAQAAIDAEKAKVAELEADLATVIAQRDSHWEEYLAERQSRMEHGAREAGYLDIIPKLTHRATVAEARADRLAKVLEETRSRVREWPIGDYETCMCGSPVASHGMGDGHSPVSQGDHAISMIVEAITEALQQETQP